MLDTLNLNFRVLDFLQCFLEHSLANVGFNWNTNL